jgi:tetratricopeptide (TPR) repeat protein
LGQYQQTIDCYEKALGYAREISDRHNEGVWLGGLGNCYGELGETQRGIEFHEQALKISREFGNRKNESADLGNLGVCYGNLGETQRAIDFCEQALEIKREIGDRRGETNHLDNLGRIFTDEDNFDKAIENLKQAIRIADDIGYLQSRNEARYNLSLALFFTNNLPYANELLKQARKCPFPPQNHHIGALQGLIYIFNKDFKAASEALAIALSETESILQKTKSNYRVLDCKGLSLSGLAVCHKSTDYAKKAKQCYQKSRSINKDKGYVKRELRLFDKLLEMDEDGILKEMRSFVAGE